MELAPKNVHPWFWVYTYTTQKKQKKPRKIPNDFFMLAFIEFFGLLRFPKPKP